MMGRSHVIGGAAVAVMGAAGLTWLSRLDLGAPSGWVARLPELSTRIRDAAQWTLDVFELPGAGVSPAMIWYPMAALAGLLFVVGTLWCDIDSKHTMLGRYLHLPLRHRGWTHTDWLFLPAAMASPFEPSGLLAWFTLGWFTHLLLDEISRAGRVHFYPLTNYKVYTTPPPDSREIVVKRHWVGLYKAGKPSEYIVLLALVIGAVAAYWAVLR